MTLRWGKTWALCSAYKSTKLVLQIRYLSYRPTSWRESALIQKPPSQIPKTLNQHEIAERQKICRWIPKTILILRRSILSSWQDIWYKIKTVEPEGLHLCRCCDSVLKRSSPNFPSNINPFVPNATFPYPLKI